MKIKRWVYASRWPHPDRVIESPHLDRLSASSRLGRDAVPGHHSATGFDIALVDEFDGKA